MPFRVSGKNIDVGDALRTRINARIAEATGLPGMRRAGVGDKDGMRRFASLIWPLSML